MVFKKRNITERLVAQQLLGLSQHWYLGTQRYGLFQCKIVPRSFVLQLGRWFGKMSCLRMYELVELSLILNIVY